MLFDILSIALAFSSIMLLFSMIVTTLVQALQSTINLRYHNLRWGLVKVANIANDIPTDKFLEGLDKLFSFGNTSVISKFSKMIGITRTEITEKELKKYIIQTAGQISEEAMANTISVFNDVEQYMSKLFQRIMHLASIVIAIILAFVFQLNTFEILREISVNPELRQSYIEMIDEVNPEFEAIKSPKTYQDLVAESLDQLAQSHESLAGKIEEVSGESGSATDAIAELRLAINDDAVIDEFAEILDARVEENDNMAKAALDKFASISTAFDFSIWPRGKEYYWGSISALNNILGTLISGVLISLGAPFWYNAIKNITSLRDKTSKRK